MSESLYIPRYLSSTILKVSKSFPVLLVTGARQVGKTTLLQHADIEAGHRHHQLVSLDEFDVRVLGKSDPVAFFQKYQGSLFIDEIQYAPELLPQIKVMVDRNKVDGQYWLSGSQQFKMMRNVSESLAGRVGILRLLGLSLAERLGVPYNPNLWKPALQPHEALRPMEIKTIFEHIVRGSFPRLFRPNAPDLTTYYGSYLQTYVDRDLRDLLKASSLANFEKFIKLCAARTGSILNLSDLARDSDISVPTAKQWLGLLESSDQIFLLRPFYSNMSKRLIKAPKLYFLDTGLACYLMGWPDADTALRGASAGPLFETFVVGEILKSYYHRGVDPRIFYYRTKDGVEVDIVMEQNGSLIPIEIKLGATISDVDTRGIQHFSAAYKNARSSAIIAPVRNAYKIGKDILVLPPTAIR